MTGSIACGRASLWLSLSALVCACGGARSPLASPAAPSSEGLAPSRLVVRQNAESPAIELRVAFAAGSADDPPDRAGLTQVTVMTMLEGRAGEVGFAERERRLFPMAAALNAHVEREQVVFSGRVHRDHLAAFYPLFRDLLLAPAFDAADFERVRTRTLSQLTQDLRGSDDETLGKEVLQAMLFEGHPYAHPELGTETGLAAIAREDLAEQWARVLCAQRVQVAASGPLEPAFSARLSADLASLRGTGCGPQHPLPPPSSLNTRRVWLVEKPEAASVAISIGLPLAVTRSHPDFAALALAAGYFGQHRTFAGRLMRKLRGDRGLNYGDYAYAEHFVQDGDSRFPLPNVSRRQQYFSLWLRPVRPEHAHFALRMAVRELEQFAKDGLSQPEFERIQRFLQHYFALYAQTEQQRLGYALDDLFYGLKEPHLEALRGRVGALTREEVNAALRRHLSPTRLQVAMIAPAAPALAEALWRGEPSPITYNVDKPKEILEEDAIIAKHPLGLAREQVSVLPLASVFR